MRRARACINLLPLPDSSIQISAGEVGELELALLLLTAGQGQHSEGDRGCKHLGMVKEKTLVLSQLWLRYWLSAFT